VEKQARRSGIKNIATRVVLLFTILSFPAFAGDINGATESSRPGFIKRWLLQKVDERMRQQTAGVPAATISLRHDGRARRYLVHEPKNRAAGLLPVVFVFHGGGGTAAQVLATCGLLKLSDEKGFLLIAPDGTGPTEESFHTWNVGFGFGTAQEQKVDDVGFFAAMLADVQKRWAVDERRLFATGISNGAILCHWLAAQPDCRLAAIAPIVGTAGGRSPGEKTWIMPPRPSKPVSVLAINGEIDQHIPLEGGLQKKSVKEAKEILSASETVRFWTDALGCAPVPECAYDDVRKTRFFRYKGGRGGAEVVLAVIVNQGHAWPGMGKPAWRGGDPSSPTYDANREMWEFFVKHPAIR